MKCLVCRSEVNDTDNFCMHCGAKLKRTCNCWVKKMDGYDCGKSSCPGLKLLAPEAGQGVAFEPFESSHCEQEEKESRKNRVASVKLEVDSSELDAAIEKTRDLIWLGEEVQTRGIFNLDDKLHFIDKEIWPKILIMNLATLVITCINIVLALAKG